MTGPFASLTFTEQQIVGLTKHLFSGDGKESVALVLCGHATRGDRTRLLAREVHPIPNELCSVRTNTQLMWPSELLVPHLERARGKQLSVVKIHSHPNGFPVFSAADDASDADLFPSIHGWVDHKIPHASVVSLPNGKMFGRIVQYDGSFSALSRIAVIGNDIRCYSGPTDARLTGDAILHTTRKGAALFGAEMTGDLGRYSVAVVGCSGLGSLVIELLARHGIGRIILIDPDRVEAKNLGRILNAFPADIGELKVDVAARAIRKLGFGIVVETCAADLATPEAVRLVSSCDFVFGCMDSLAGRALLNRLATFYVMPYIDLGVRIDADPTGFVEQVCGAVRYLRPGGSSLTSRGMFSYEDAQADAVKRTDRERYEQLRKERYIRGINEEQPAVMALNMAIAPLGVMELFARMYRFRDDPNSRYATATLSLTQMGLYADAESAPCKVLQGFVGRGDMAPLLDLPELSE
ncbi:MAG TPA: ThiF family adenylyltransferase [Pseudolabrys sp.]|nr:ThiF family adenylyltransferase [Pseudolabrys sp.]